MKKTLPLLAVAASLLVTGCQGGRNKFEDHFKEYSFKAMVADKDKEPIQEGYKKAMPKVSSIEIIEEEYSKHGYTESSKRSKTTIKIKEDASKAGSLIAETSKTTEIDNYDNGISYKSSEKDEIKEWYDSGRVYKAILSTIDGKKDKQYVSTTTSLIAAYYRDTYIKNYFSNVVGNYFYKDDGSYAIITSEKSKRVTAQEWGKETKEYTSTYKAQGVFSVNKNYQITSYYGYTETKANWDSATGEWFDSERLVTRHYYSVKYKYETREKASISALNASWNK